MSGTSLDGLDIAVCRISGHGCDSNISLEHFITCDYDDAFKQQILTVFAKPQVCFESLCLLNATIAQTHAKLINQQLKEWGISAVDIDLIASHGQTVFHAPKSLHKRLDKPNATLQIGDGDHLAALTGIITISDFRQKHVAYGGEGAPLAMYGDYLILGDANIDRYLLNIGGIANFTFLPAQSSFNHVICSDVGPGNTLMDAFVRKHFGIDYDKDAQLAMQGKLLPSLFADLIGDAFFKLPLPKTTGPEYFNMRWLSQYLDNRDTAHNTLDILCTLNHLSAFTIASSMQQLLNKASHKHSVQILTSGGGSHNQFLIGNIEHYLGFKVAGNTNVAGIQPDAKEAILFALLANETVAGHPSTFGGNLSDIDPPQISNKPAISMGKISLP